MKPLRVLLVEDDVDDADLLIRHLRTVGGFDVRHARVETREAMAQALSNATWDLILSDYSLPHFDAPNALEEWNKHGVDIPFIVITATIGEERAVALMKSGADDFILKGNFQRLIPAIERELREAENRRKKREMEAERVRLLEELQELLRLRDQFLLLASHELMTPLTPIRLGNEALKIILSKPSLDATAVDRARATVATSHTQIERLIQLCQQLLDVSRLREGKLDVDKVRTDFTALVGETVDSFRNRAHSYGCEIEAEMPRISRFALLDPTRVGGVIANLLSNAIKFGPGKPILVSLTEVQGIARLAIQDFGIGIEAKDQPRLFQRFERAVPSQHYGGGLGLGLYLARQVIEAHGGKIGLESELGKGSTFWVELPLLT